MSKCDCRDCEMTELFQPAVNKADYLAKFVARAQADTLTEKTLDVYPVEPLTFDIEWPTGDVEMRKGETRTTSSTGGEKGVKPEALDQLPVVALRELGRVFAFGAAKYERDNWKKGYEWSKSYAAAQRHLTAWWQGEDDDPESKLSHLMHAAWHLFTLYWRQRQQSAQREVGFDDRPKGEAWR